MTLSTGEDRHELFPYYGKMGYAVIEIRPSVSPAFKRAIRVVTMAKSLAPASTSA